MSEKEEANNKILIKTLKDNMGEFKKDFRDDMSKIETSVSNLHAKMDAYANLFVVKEDYRREHEQARKDIESKLDREDWKNWLEQVFNPLNTKLSRINMVIITTVVTGLLTLLFTSLGKK